jgi:alpha-1,2-mannosyltransferase
MYNQLVSTVIQRPKSVSTLLPRSMTLASVYVWIGIFIVQPHKEERFMYVIYPLICYNAAHALDSFIHAFDFVAARIPIPQTLQRDLKSFILCGLALVYFTFSAARVLAQVRGFSAPMQVLGGVESSSTVCLGKEWYRFPSSFFIPETSRAMFVKSAFDGLLPGRFPEEKELGWRGGTSKIPASMNDRNLEELSHLVNIPVIPSLTCKVPIESCDFLLDSDFSSRYRQNSSVENDLEPRHCINPRLWSRVKCRPFLDSMNSGLFGRSIWLPIQALDQTMWGEFCLLKSEMRRQEMR